MSKSVPLVGYWALWWLVSLGLWLLWTSTVSCNEVVAGFGAAAVAATAASEVHAREKVATPLRPGRGLVRFGLGLPPRPIAGTPVLTPGLARRLARGRLGGGVPGGSRPAAGRA